MANQMVAHMNETYRKVAPMRLHVGDEILVIIAMTLWIFQDGM
jgi:hypothetical protein